MSLLPRRHLRRDRRGNVAMMYALALPVLMFAIGLAIDYTHAAQVRTQLNAAADAAVLAALTPGMMQQSNATAQTAAQNMFNGQIAGITSLAAGDTTVTVTVANPTGTTLVRNVTVAYSAQNTNIFAGILGAPTFTLKGSSSASASVAANIDFYMLLDNSPSMALPATQAGIAQMESLTAQQENGVGCAFACHQASLNNCDTEGNSCVKTSNGKTTYSAPTVTETCTVCTNSSCNTTYTFSNAQCGTTQGTQIDNYQVARNNNITLRLDDLSTGVTNLMSDAYTTQQNTASTPPVYRFAAYSMDSSWQVGMSSSNSYNQLMALTTNYVSGWQSASPNFTVMEYYSNNVPCANSGCTSALTGVNNDFATNYDNAFSTMNTLMPNPGQGTNVKGDTPQEVLFLVTDGVEDENTTTCSEPLQGGNRCQAPVNPTLCTTIKNRGIRIAILYTDYYQVTADWWYNNYVAPFQSSIATELEACASPGLFYDAGLDASNLGGALQTLFNTVVQTAHLTN
ncbi:MAG: pilus assembly protein TadG-related protein [Roseiarcus sp.]|jgi:Flp pilus assembly protein TadG